MRVLGVQDPQVWACFVSLLNRSEGGSAVCTCITLMYRLHTAAASVTGTWSVFAGLLFKKPQTNPDSGQITSAPEIRRPGAVLQKLTAEVAWVHGGPGW